MIVAQLGSRMHYAVPQILHSLGGLDQLYTDISAETFPVSLLRHTKETKLPSGLRSLLGRRPGIQNSHLVSTNTYLGLSYAITRRRGTHSPRELVALHLRFSKAFAVWVSRQAIPKYPGRAVYAFNSAALEIFEAMERQALFGRVLEQTIAPKKFELQVLACAAERYPGWAVTSDFENSGVNHDFCAREMREVELANQIICGSDFVKRTLVDTYGISTAAKCIVVPYGVEAISRSRQHVLNIDNAPARARQPGPLRVLIVGAVGLRKGGPTVMTVARALRGLATFRWVGPVDAPDSVILNLAEVVELTGPKPRQEVAQHYAWADVFFLPSFCEGSATSTYEALTHGLPVFCTPNSGSIVQDGVNGFVIDPDDSDAFVARFKEVSESTDLLAELQNGVCKTASQATVAAYRERLSTALSAILTEETR